MSQQTTLSPEMLACIELCRRCQMVCLSMATGHCLEKGGRHVEPEHLRTMIVCAEICQTAANVMATNSTLHRQVCAVCADICDACISSCRDLDEMEECIFACERCKNSCEAMTSV
ncbi:four-helix bundle copper-binding protein [Aromatoleum buckelii]|uniref:Four-helix bundle copper-binding protein n=1 Tax=Aromatoleum buckelii TaxID=200254 RepID=A0ABX1N1S9_9RHOO|nr:four-helix bundle copper-binding protein [Aromatoleum buckelii]MCK0512602.1 four-helix bundle copper-binding protein [Aromatoleum buckelii]